jgi:ubiquinone/menaquinone biosynthesis C-methylase UbiE
MSEAKNDIVNCWDTKASQWKTLVGQRGDNNRFFNSDPILWQLLGDVSGKSVLDAGCGTGYLSALIAQKSAQVTGVDISPKMIQEAQSFALETGRQIDFRVDSCSELSSISDSSMDAIVSNYVMMDLPDLPQAMANFHRVLKPGGKCVLVFSHPCFDELTENEMYFDEIKKIDRWGLFDSDFLYFHRPLSEYWKAFKKAGFTVEEFDEPVAQDPTVEGFKEEWKKNYRKRPWSVAFLLRK